MIRKPYTSAEIVDFWREAVHIATYGERVTQVRPDDLSTPRPPSPEALADRDRCFKRVNEFWAEPGVNITLRPLVLMGEMDACTLFLAAFEAWNKDKPVIKPLLRVDRPDDGVITVEALTFQAAYQRLLGWKWKGQMITLYQAAYRGQLDAVRYRGRWYVSSIALDKWFRERAKKREAA